MTDIFQAYSRDGDEPMIKYEVMEQSGSFWYHSGYFETEEQASRYADRIFTEDSTVRGVIVDRVTREVLKRRLL